MRANWIKNIKYFKPEIKSRSLIIIASIYFATVLNAALWKYIIEHISIGSARDVLFALTMPFLLVSAMLIIITALTPPYLGKIILCVLAVASAYASYSMMAYGIVIDADMVQNVFETNLREALDLTTFPLVASVILFGVIPSIALFMTKIIYGSAKREIITRAAIIGAAFIIIGAIAALFYKEYVSFGRNNSKLARMITPGNYIQSVIKYFERLRFKDMKLKAIGEDAEYVGGDKPNLFILIVGETARSRNFSLGGYDRETNPATRQIGDVIYFQNVSSCGTATALSVPCMFSALDRKSYDPSMSKWTENLLDVAQRAGYKVLWRENDDGCKGVCARVESETMIESKNAAKYCDKLYCYDEVLLDGLESYIQGAPRNALIVLHTIGSHGPTYYKRYPDRFKVFTPSCDTAEINRCSNEALVNTYDNTIVYTDFIIAETIKILNKFPDRESSLLYVSDHGESLGEKGIYLHGIPYAFAPEEQTHVPMILWLSENFKRNVSPECLKKSAAKNEYSHDNLFHSVLGALRVRTSAYDEKLDIFSPCYANKSKER